jgi:AcrR family transcriptional regulator
MQNASGVPYRGTVTTTTDPARTTRRRAETRARLLAAALEVLGEQGLARSSVEGVCERAGFTRGAFYSNFATMDDVVAALYEDQAGRVVDHVERRLADAPRQGPADGPAAATDPADPADPADPVAAVVAHVLDVLPVDRQWHAVRTEFTAQALRNPDAARAVTAQRTALRRRLAPVLEAALTRAGRRLTVPAEELARALVTAQEGLVTPALLGDGPAAPGFETRVLTGVITAFTEAAA